MASENWDASLSRDVLGLPGSSKPIVKYTPEDVEELYPANVIILIREIAQQGVPSRSSFFQYAVECYAKSIQIQQMGRGRLDISEAEFLDAHNTLRNSIISVTQMVLTLPDEDEFQREYTRSHKDLYKYLSAGKLGRQLPQDFFKLLCRENWDDDESIQAFINPIFAEVQGYMGGVGVIKDNVIPIITVTEKVLSQVKCLQVFIKAPGFLPAAQNGALLERMSLLLRVLAYRADNGHDPFNQKLFMGFKTMPPRTQMQKLQQFRGLVNSVQDSGFNIFKRCLQKKLLPERERVLGFLSTVTKLNMDRRKMRCNPMTVSSDGMLTNLSYIMLKLTLPILKGKNRDGTPRATMIQTEFFIQDQNYVDYTNVSRISATTAELQEMRQNMQPVELNFMTKMLALGLEILHIGLIKSLGMLRELAQQQQRLQRMGDMFGRAEQIGARLFAVIAHYYDPKLIREALVFYDLVGQWILALAETNPEACGVLPEYVFDDVISIYNALNDVPQLRKDCKNFFSESSLMSFCIKLLADNTPCKNIHHRGKLINVIGMFVPRDYETRPTHTYITHVLNQVPEAKELVPRLLKLYADVEQGDYYRRHNYRYELANILKFLWNYETHHNAIQFMWNNTPTNFIRMINMLINDNILILDEAFAGLTKLHNLENAPDAASEENAKKHQELEERMKGQNQLALANLELLCWLTQNIQEPFFDQRIIGRMATMVDFYLKKLTLEKSALKTKSQQVIKFEPKKLIRNIVTIFRQLANFNSDFLRAVSEEEAYYSKEAYAKASKILSRIKESQQIISEFVSLSQQIEVFKTEVADLESRLGDIPEDYLDPMLYTLMRDPVRLPTNGMVMDRKQISTQLLNKSECPFTKRKLTVDQLEPVPELKAEIDAWIKQRLEETKNASKSAADDVEMQGSSSVFARKRSAPFQDPSAKRICVTRADLS